MFTLLSDPGSETIKRYGILNTVAEEALGPMAKDPAERFADEIPHRAVDARDRLEQRLSPAAHVAQREHPFPDALGLQKAEPANAGRELFADHPHDLESVFAVVAVVHLADEAVLGAHPRDHGGALQDGVGAAAEVLPERNVDGRGVDAVNAHVRRSYPAAEILCPDPARIAILRDT